MKFDNGMTIVGAVDAEKFSGRVISGHIHKRQETPKVVYVGSPYQMSRGDIGNQKGIYLLTLEDGELIFTPNNFSPVFQKLDIKQFMNMTDAERREKLSGNYTDIVIDEADVPNYKMADIYELMNTSGAKRAQLEVKKSKIDVSDDEDGRSTDEKTVEELIDQAIESLEGVDEQTIAELKVLSSQYLSAAREAEDKK
jgi:DNA repair exonuclease SbcCD nuclease subunit